MVASLLRLLHSGFQDTRLIGIRIETRQFKYVLTKNGRFTTQWQRVDFDNKPNFGKTCVVTLPRKGHLITRIYLVATMPDIRTPQLAAQKAGGSNFAGPVFGWTNSLGHALINNMTLEIGGSRVEQMDGQLLEVLDEFYTPIEKVQNVNNMILRKPNGFNEYSFGWKNQYEQVVVPLPFWFSKGDLGVPLPIDGLYIDNVRISINLRDVGSLYTTPARIEETRNIIPTKCSPRIRSSLIDINGTSFYVFDSNGIAIPSIYPFNPNALLTKIPGQSMPATYTLGDTYLMVEYVTLDKPEANRFRQAEFTMPVIQHYILDRVTTKGQSTVEIPLRIPNPTRNIFFFAQRDECPGLNTYFLATRDLSGAETVVQPWWPDCSGLDMKDYQDLVPAFTTRDSDPLQSLSLVYEGNFTRFSTENTALFRSILPSLELVKAPLFNKYYYCLPFSMQAGKNPDSIHLGEANLDKIHKVSLFLEFRSLEVINKIYPTYNILMYVETYNILKMYGGRAGLLFGY
jgi:hypothetical protein